MKRILLSTLLIFIFISPDIIFADNIVNEETVINSIDDYINYLENYDREEALARGVDSIYINVAILEAKKDAKKIKLLSPEEKDALLHIIKNPQVIFNSKHKTASNILIDSNHINELFYTQQSNYSERLIGHIDTYKHLNTNSYLFQVEIKGHYQVFGNNVTKILNNSSRVMKNTIPNTTYIREINIAQINNGSEYEGQAAWRVLYEGSTTAYVKADLKGDHIGKTYGKIYGYSYEPR